MTVEKPASVGKYSTEKKDITPSQDKSTRPCFFKKASCLMKMLRGDKKTGCNRNRKYCGATSTFGSTRKSD